MDLMSVSPTSAALRASIHAREMELEFLKASASTGRPTCALAIVSFSAHFRVLVQFFLSYAANVVDPASCAILVMVSTPTEKVELRRWLDAPSYAAQLEVVRPLVTLVDFPAVRQQLSPASSSQLPLAKNVGPYGRLYVCAKKAYAIRYAHEILRAPHVIVTDSEAYVWKPFSVTALFASSAQRPTVWYSDAPFHLKQRRRRADGAAPIDTTWCSQHVYGDMRGTTRSAIHNRSISSTAGYFEYMAFYFPRGIFRKYWAAVESAWNKPWYDAVVAAYDAEPRCIGIGFWLEVSWHVYLYEQHRPHFTFRNVTEALEVSFGTQFVQTSLYVHARLELLWRAVNNQTLASYHAFYRRYPLPFFRFEFRARGMCLPLRLVAELPSPAASMQANSAVPNWVFSTCKRELAQIREEWNYSRAQVTFNRTSRLPWVPHKTIA
jgi:hypothetical protein